MMGSKDREELNKALLLPGLSSECSWVLGDGTRSQMCGNHGGESLLVTTARRVMQQVGAQHRLGEHMSLVEYQKHEESEVGSTSTLSENA